MPWRPAHAVEIYNGVAADANDRPESWHILDVLLDRRQRYFAYAADDAHFTPNYHDFRRGWVQVKAEELSPEALLSALKSGAFYSSTGPQIYDITVIPGERLTVYCSPAERIFLTGVGSASQRAWGNGLTSAEFDLSEWDSHYCRVTVRDRLGGRAGRIRSGYELLQALPLRYMSAKSCMRYRFAIWAQT